MTEQRYLKAPAYHGKTLTIYVGGGDKRIQDGVYYYGGMYAKFVGMGMMIVAPPDEVAQAKVAQPKKSKSAPKTTKAQRDAAAADKKAAEEAQVAAEAKAAAKALREEAKAEAGGGVTKSPASPSPGSKRSSKK